MDTNNNSTIQQLLEALTIFETSNTEASKRGENYNIFNILNNSTSELAHSAIIANLLNPEGAHGLGEKPLRSFLKLLDKPNLQFSDADKVKVECEKSISDTKDDEWGRMDIVISSDAEQIIIENKIYAPDQPQQLIRYSNYAKSSRKKTKILYLTLDKHAASEYSAEGMTPGEDYYRISYRDHIIYWIEECIKMAYNKPLVRETLVQYKNILNMLTADNHYSDSKIELYSAILNCKDEIPAYTVEKLLSCIGDDFISYAIKWIVDKIDVLAQENDLTVKFSDGFCTGGRYCGFYFQKCDWVKSVAFGFTQPYWKGCYFGVYSSESLPVDRNKKMVGMTDNPNDHYCYGNAFTSCKDWTREAFISGKVLPSIKVALDYILKELKEHPDKYPMK